MNSRLTGLDLDLLKDEGPATPEQVADAVASNARGISIKGIMLRGYEVAAYNFIKPEDGWHQLQKFGNAPSALLKAEQEAKYWFGWEQKQQDMREAKARKDAEKKGEEYVPIPDTKRAIRIRYIVSIDPSTIESVE